MRTIELICGTTIENAAKMLVENAPACADFNGIVIRARYATTRPADLVAMYDRGMSERAEAWKRSGAGKACAAESAAADAACQADVDACLACLPSLDFDDASAVVGWIERIAHPADRVNVRLNKAAVIATFAAHGWGAGVNCGEDFDAGDARNFAGWVAGQWLANGHPMAERFAAQWRERFETMAEVA